MTWDTRITRRILGPLEVNTYIVAGDQGECLVVDPGGCAIIQEVEQIGCTRITVAVTHGHFDHTQGVDCLVEAGASLAAHPMEPEVARASVELAGLLGIPVSRQKSKPGILLNDGIVLAIAGLRLEVLHTRFYILQATVRTTSYYMTMPGG